MDFFVSRYPTHKLNLDSGWNSLPTIVEGCCLDPQVSSPLLIDFLLQALPCIHELCNCIDLVFLNHFIHYLEIGMRLSSIFLWTPMVDFSHPCTLSH